MSGTTLRVYRYLYRAHDPQGIHDVQRALGLSSPSVAGYHIKKLFDMGLIKQTDGENSTSSSKYYVDRLIFENMIRFRRALIPLQVGYLSFFGSAFVVLIMLIETRGTILSLYFSVFVIALACGVFGYEALKAFRKSWI